MRYFTSSALIIGGSSGIGLAIARILASEQTQVILVGRDSAKLMAARGRFDDPGNVKLITGDISKPAGIERIVNAIDSEELPLMYLVNSAGVFTPKPFLEHNVQDYDRYHDLNRGTFLITQAATRAMIKAGGGSILNIGSMWAHQAIKATPSSAYSMAKSGLHAFTQHLAMELANYKIRVNAIAPAVVDTPIYNSFVRQEEHDTVLHSFDAFHPIGRIGSAEDIANAAQFLLAPKSSWITGEILNVDGGVMAGRN